MERESYDDHRAAERTEAERDRPGSAPATPELPFASEGLEQIRDTHC